MNFKNKKMTAFWSIVASLGVILVVFGNGCNGGFEVLSMNDSSSTAVTMNTSENDVIPGTKTVSLVYSNQILDQLTSCSGVTNPSDATLKMFDEKKGAISTTGSADSMNPAMMMAVISIAGEVCNDLISQEISSGGRIFKNMDLQSNDLPPDSSLKEAISKLALSCWSRPEDSMERSLLLDMVYKSIAVSEAQAAKKSALMVCTSVLSSLDSLLN